MSRFSSKKFDVFAALESAYGTAPAAANFQQLQIHADTFSPPGPGATDMIDPAYAREDGYPDQLLAGRQTADIGSFQMPLRGNSGVMIDTETPDLISELAIIKASMLVDEANPTAAITGGSTSTFTHGGTNPDIGCMYYILPISTSTVGEYRQIKTSAAGTVGFDDVLSTACVDGIAHSSVMITPDKTVDDSFSFAVNQETRGGVTPNFMYSGLQGPCKIMIKPGEGKDALARIEFAFKGDNWDASDTAVVTTATATGPFTLTNPITAKSINMTIDGESIPFYGIDIDFGQEFSENIDGTQTNARDAAVVTAIRSTGVIKVPYDPSLTFDPNDYEAGSIHRLLISGGDHPNSFAIGAYAMQISESPSKTDNNGIHCYEIPVVFTRSAISNMPPIVLGLFGNDA